MGLLAKYECAACGYGTGELTLGPGPEPARFDPRLVSCATCKTLRVVDARAATRGCGTHRAPFILHDVEEDVPCPRCGGTLTCEPVAPWD